MKKSFLACYFFLILLLNSCAQSNTENKLCNFFSYGDYTPPVLLQVYMKDEKTAVFVFDEDVVPLENSFSVSCELSQSGNKVFAVLRQFLKPGNEQVISGSVSDKSGNTTRIKVNLCGYNSHPAVLLINEFTTKGTERQPDRTELAVLADGSTAGMVLYDGVPSDYRQSVKLPDLNVKKGDYIVVRWNESSVNTVSQDNVYDINAGGTGLSDNNGILVLALTSLLSSEVCDCVVYSSMSSNQYDGFGTKAVYHRVQTALENSWWKGDAVLSSNSTSTRSMNRKTEETDTDGSDDWYVCTTGGSSFGSRNSSEQFQPSK